MTENHDEQTATAATPDHRSRPQSALMLTIPCIDPGAAHAFASLLSSEGIDGAVVEERSVRVPTDSPGFAWILAEIAVENNWAHDANAAVAVRHFLEGPDGLVTRERMRRVPEDFLIWSQAHGWWTAPSGYTTDLGRASTFPEAEALQVCEDANSTWTSLNIDGPPPEVMIPLTDNPQEAASAVEKAAEAAIEARAAAAASWRQR